MILQNYLIKEKASAFNKSNLFRYYLQIASRGQCEVFAAADDDGEYIGIAFGEIASNGVGMLKYISVKNSMRRQGVALAYSGMGGVCKRWKALQK